MPRIRSLIAIVTMMSIIVSAWGAPQPSGESEVAIKADDTDAPVGVQASGSVEALTTVLVASGLTRPIFVTSPPEDFNRLFIVEKRGVIKILDLTTGVVLATPFLDIDSFVGGGLSDGDERGLLGLAFHPDYVNTGFFYVYYTNNSNTTVIARYTVSANPDLADAASASIVLTYAQPSTNHNGGWIGFGPLDGYLYIASGDGGGSCDPSQRAQNIALFLGKMLRIDIDGDDFPANAIVNYAIPPGNPFVGVTGTDEIWAYGLRNPWRPSFDRATGDLYIADVGQGAWEEIDFQPASSPGGENYGWDCREGAHCSIDSGCVGHGCDCLTVSSVDPVYEYPHADGNCSITGGYVYRGCAIPSLDGTYFYADYCTGKIWTFRYDGVSLTELTDRTVELAPAGGGFTIGSFGEDATGELHIVEQSDGVIYKIIPAVMSDTNGNGIPDSCDLFFCPSDFNISGDVNVTDLLLLLSAWGPNPGHVADINNDGNVNVTDLLALLAAWGACP